MRKVKHPCLPKWRARITRATKRGFFTGTEASAACRWHTCACGEAKKLYDIATNANYKNAPAMDRRPKDRVLERLGFDFSSAVDQSKQWDMWGHDSAPELRTRNLKLAAQVLDKIEARLTRLMNRA